MSWLFGKPSATKPDYTGLQLQTSVATLPIGIIWGRNKIAPNIIWYANFQTHAHSSGGGGKGGLFGGGGGTSYTYSADLIMALGEGPIAGVGEIWRDQSTYSLANLGLTLYDGATPQSVWGYLSSEYPNQALAYQGTAFACAANYDLGSSANIGNHNFEVIGMLAGTGVNGLDADPAQVIYDFLTNPQYGAGFDAARIDLTTLYGSGSDASLQAYCAAIGICFSPALVNAEQGSAILTRWLQLCNCGAVWSEGTLRFVPYGDSAITAGNVTRSVEVAVPEPPTDSTGATPNPTIRVCAAASFVSDGGVVYSMTGAALTKVSGTPSAGHYQISPNGTYVFATADKTNAVTITYTYSMARGFMPNLTPILALADLDFVDDKGNLDPVQVSRADPFSLPNIIRISVSSRDNQYSSTPIEARDQSQIELYGARVGSTISANEICDDVLVAPGVAQTILQRQLYVRAQYSFKLSWEYCFLDPMDVVSISDSNLLLSSTPVRIIAIEEDDNGLLSVTAEEIASGVSTPAANVGAGSRGYQPNLNAGAQPVNTPLIYEPPSTLTSGVAQVWVGASGEQDPNWGGAFVYASLDNVSYSEIATLSAPLRQGLLTASLAAASGWDTTDTLSVNLSESLATLDSTTATGAQSGATLSLVDGELLAYESATLTGPNAYGLTGLQRGLYGTAGGSHASGAAFARLDSAVAKVNLPANYIGSTLYFKFQSFNGSGGGLQDLSTCAVYTYTPDGSGTFNPVVTQLASGMPLDLGAASDSPALSDDFGSVGQSFVSGALDLGVA